MAASSTAFYGDSAYLPSQAAKANGLNDLRRRGDDVFGGPSGKCTSSLLTKAFPKIGGLGVSLARICERKVYVTSKSSMTREPFGTPSSRQTCTKLAFGMA